MWGKRIAPQQKKVLPFLPGSLLNDLLSFSPIEIAKLSTNKVATEMINNSFGNSKQNSGKLKFLSKLTIWGPNFF